MQVDPRPGATRRELLAGSLRAAAALPLALLAGGALTGCPSEGTAPQQPPAPPKPTEPAAPPPDSPAPPVRPTEPALPEPPQAGGGAPDGVALVSQLPEQAPMVAALQYVDASPNPDQRCANCQLFSAAEGGVGKCQLFATGFVREGGWCASWAQRVG